MKKYYSFLLIALSTAGFSQVVIPNAGFENWQNLGLSTEEPTSWNANKTGGGFANLTIQTCFRDVTSPHSGASCLKSQPSNYLGWPVNGITTTGKVQQPTNSPSSQYVQTVRSEANFNVPFTGRPENFTGFFKFLSPGSTSARFKVILHGDYDVKDPADAGSIPYIIATAEFTTPPASVTNWTSFSVPLTYFSADIPMYILVVSDCGNTPGNTLWVDDLGLTYPLGIEESEESTDKIIAYPNPTHGNVSLHLESLKNVSVNVYDINGKSIYSDKNINQPDYSFELKASPGQYLIEVTSENRKKLSKIIKI